MPTYDYQCQKCDFEFEREQRITEDPIKTCPKCKSRKAKRLLSASNFILKGGGWYADGYGSPGAKKSADNSADKGDSDKSASDGASSKKDDSTSKSKTKDSSSSSGSSSSKESGGESSKSKTG
jgi:putative FmdB family regulatory protein